MVHCLTFSCSSVEQQQLNVRQWTIYNNAACRRQHNLKTYCKVYINGFKCRKNGKLQNSFFFSFRVFIVKQGFFLYYSESEKTAFDKKGCFNIHPKGVIPAGGCIIQASTELGQDYVIRSTNDSFVHVSECKSLVYDYIDACVRLSEYSF
jgi:hypothetical protein